MMNFRDLLAFDAGNTFVSDFAEWITYTPYKGLPIRLLANVYRNIPKAIQGLQGAATYEHEIEIPNSPSTGVTEIHKGNDSVTLGNEIHGRDETFVVMQIVKSDEGLWLLGVG